jgi:hypothetical protein
MTQANEQDPAAILLVHGSRPGPIQVEIVRVTRKQAQLLRPFLRFLETLPKPPGQERIMIIIGFPDLLDLILRGSIRLGTLEVVERAAGLHIILPDDRWGASGAVAEWIAVFRDRLRERLMIRAWGQQQGILALTALGA